MKILMMNNFNYARGGAENVFLSEIDLLKKNGHDVTVFSRRHPRNQQAAFSRYFPSEMVTDAVTLSAKGLRSLLGLFYSPESKRRLMALLDTIEVDVAHAHNIYARLTTSVLDALTRRGVPTVMTLHDYKVICPNYKLMHHGRICEDCRGNGYYHAVLNRCHKDSLAASAIYGLETYFNFLFNKYRGNVWRFISPSRFLKDKLIEFGWPGDRIEHIPNFMPVGDFEPSYAPGEYFLYIGRLSTEKGIETLIKAFSHLENAGARLKIAGEGPLGGQLKQKAASDSRIVFCGYLSGASLEETTRKALAVVVPSEWYENAPLSVLEAMAYGKPVIGARIGGIPEMIEDGSSGFLYEPGDAGALTRAMCKISGMEAAAVEAMGRRARRKVEEEYNADLHYQRLAALYRKAAGRFFGH